jgi:hypothetical protein
MRLLGMIRSTLLYVSRFEREAAFLDDATLYEEPGTAKITKEHERENLASRLKQYW